MKKDTYYFSHDATAKDDPKIMLVIDQLGPEGYGIFWILVETLRTQPDYKCPLSVVPSLARRYNTTAEKMLSVVKSYELFVIEDGAVFFSESLNRRMALADAKRLKLSEAGKLGNAIKYGVPSPGDRNPIATRSQLNKTKVNKTKGKKFIAPSLDEFKNYFKEHGFKESVAERAWRGYDVANWHDSENKPVLNWKQKCQNVWFKDENKIDIIPNAGTNKTVSIEEVLSNG